MDGSQHSPRASGPFMQVSVTSTHLRPCQPKGVKYVSMCVWVWVGGCVCKRAFVHVYVSVRINVYVSYSNVGVANSRPSVYMHPRVYKGTGLCITYLQGARRACRVVTAAAAYIDASVYTAIRARWCMHTCEIDAATVQTTQQYFLTLHHKHAISCVSGAGVPASLSGSYSCDTGILTGILAPVVGCCARAL